MRITKPETLNKIVENIKIILKEKNMVGVLVINFSMFAAFFLQIFRVNYI